MRLKRTLFLLFISTHCYAAVPLQQQLLSYLQQRDAKHANQMSITINTPPSNWPSCAMPTFGILGNAPHWGKLTVSAQCGARKYFLQVNLSVIGRYFVAKQAIGLGNTVSASSLVARQGDLAQLPAQAYYDQLPSLPAVALQNIAAGKVITRNLLRQPWLVLSNQRVTVALQGEGFQVMTEGYALTHAAADEWVNIRLNSGRIIKAKVVSSGKVRVEQ